MTVSTTIIKSSHNGNGSTTTFAYSFKIFADTDLVVIIRSSTGTETTKSLSTHYTVSGAGDASGGSITFTSGNTPASGETVVIRRNVPQTQAIDYIANDPFPAETNEEGLDRTTMIAQQVSEEADRSIKLSRTNTMTSTEFTVGATDRANKILAFDSSGEISVTQELGTFKGSSATVTTSPFVQRDIVKSTTTAELNNIYICVADSVVGDSLTDTDHFALLVDAVSSATSATASASSATASASSATASANSATASANSATAAASSATSAANSFDDFDDRYLGAKSSEPSTDNDGDALVTGALFFDTTAGAMKVYTGSAWQTVTVSAANQANINTVAGISSNVTTVAGISSNVTTVAGISSDVTAVAGISSDIQAVENIKANVTTVAGISANVTTVAGISSNVTSVASNSSNINTVAGNNSNVTTVATNISSVNNFAAQYRVGSSDPTSSLDEGDLFYNTTSNELKYYNGSAWVAIVSDTDVKVSVSANDTTPGFLNGKLVAGTNVSLTEGNDGGNETLTIAASGASAGFAVAMAIAL